MSRRHGSHVSEAGPAWQTSGPSALPLRASVCNGPPQPLELPTPTPILPTSGAEPNRSRGTAVRGRQAGMRDSRTSPVPAPRDRGPRWQESRVNRLVRTDQSTIHCSPVSSPSSPSGHLCPLRPTSPMAPVSPHSWSGDPAVGAVFKKTKK